MSSMLARGSELLSVPIVAIVFGFVYLMVRVSARERERRFERERRYALLEKAIESGAIDERTKRELLETVTDRPRSSPSQPWTLPAVLLASGWVGIFAGAALVLVGTIEDQDLVPIGTIVGLVSFGIVSVPVALRELHASKA